MKRKAESAPSRRTRDIILSIKINILEFGRFTFTETLDSKSEEMEKRKFSPLYIFPRTTSPTTRWYS